MSVAPVPGSGEPGVSFGVHAAQALEQGVIDGFWANAMGAEVAVRSGVGTVALDPRRGIGPAAAKEYTFAALVTTDRLIEESSGQQQRRRCGLSWSGTADTAVRSFTSSLRSRTAAVPSG